MNNCKMGDDGEIPTNRSKGNSWIDAESRNEEQIFETIRTSELLDLNDDCLDDIFGNLDVMDLCSVAQVCKRFQQLAQSLFRRKFKGIDFGTSFTNRLNSGQEARNLVHIFGHMIKRVSISTQRFGNNQTVELLKDLVECCGNSLHTLTLKDFLFTSHAVDTLNILSESLQSLALLGCDLIQDCVFHLSNFSTLKRLEITHTNNCYALMESFPALKCLKLYEVSISSECILNHFFATHKQLETLKIRRCDGISSDVCRTIGKYMENLETLHLCGNLSNKRESIVEIENNILHLGELKNLQRFGWQCSYRSQLSIGNLLNKMRANKIAMKVLSISYSVVDDKTIKEIKKMKHLEGLEVFRTNGLKNQHLIEIGKELTQLKELCIASQENVTFDVLKEVLCHTKQLEVLRIDSEKYPLDPTLYNDILNIVKERGNGIWLIIEINSIDKENLIPQQTINMNKMWLMIVHQ